MYCTSSYYVSRASLEAFRDGKKGPTERLRSHGQDRTSASRGLSDVTIVEVTGALLARLTLESHHGIRGQQDVAMKYGSGSPFGEVRAVRIRNCTSCIVCQTSRFYLQADCSLGEKRRYAAIARKNLGDTSSIEHCRGSLSKGIEIWKGKIAEPGKVTLRSWGTYLRR